MEEVRTTLTRRAGGGDALLVMAWQALAETGTAALLLDPSRTALWCNQALAAMLRLVPGEIIGQRLSTLRLMAPSISEEVEWTEAAAKLIDGEEHSRRDVVLQAVSGAMVRVTMQFTPLETAGGRGALLTFVPVLSPSSESPEASVAAVEARFSAVVDAAPIGIFLSETGARLGQVNDRFGELLGLAPAQALGTNWLNKFDGTDLPAVLSAIEEVLHGHPRDLTVRLQDTALVRHVHLRLSPLIGDNRAAGFIGTAEDITERQARDRQITYQAQHDPLTGLINRRRLIEVLQEMLAGRRSRDRQFALMFFDLDGFKKINDTYGHETGDRVLVEIAQRMRLVAREHDLVGRVAGDEFVIVLRGMKDLADVEAAARRHLEILSRPMSVAGKQQSISVSIGVAVPLPNDTVETLFRAADRMMYEAKHAGGSRYRLSASARVSSRGLSDGATPVEEDTALHGRHEADQPQVGMQRGAPSVEWARETP